MERAHQMKQKAVDYLGGKCKECGYNKCIYALEFHHLGNKEYAPTKMFQKGLSWDKIKKEIDKCELLCANCHREKTFNTTVA